MKIKYIKEMKIIYFFIYQFQSDIFCSLLYKSQYAFDTLYVLSELCAKYNFYNRLGNVTAFMMMTY